MGAEAYAQGTNDMLPFAANPSVQSVNLKEFIQLVKDNNPLLQVQYQEDGPSMMSFPTPNFFLPIDTVAVKKLGIIPKGREKQLVAPHGLEHGQARHREEKPGDSGHDCYQQLAAAHLLQQHRGAQRLHEPAALLPARRHGLPPAPAEGPQLRPPQRRRRLRGKRPDLPAPAEGFQLPRPAKPGIFYDENNLRFPANYRDKFARLANAYLADNNVAKAKEVANKALELMPDNTIPYDYYSPQLVPALVAGGEKAKADQILDTMTQRSEQMLAYYATKPDGSLFEDDQRGYLLGLQSVYRAAELSGDKARSEKALGLMNQYYPR